LEFWKFSLANGNLKTFQLSFLDSAVYVYFWGPSPSVFVVSYLPFAPFGYAPVPCFDESEHLVLASLPLAMIVLLERAEQNKPAFGIGGSSICTPRFWRFKFTWIPLAFGGPSERVCHRPLYSIHPSKHPGPCQILYHFIQNKIDTPLDGWWSTSSPFRPQRDAWHLHSLTTRREKKKQAEEQLLPNTEKTAGQPAASEVME
jgi:hypothetical protein